jgi:hypothetical protein
MLLDGGELEGVRVLTPKAVREMTSDQLLPNIRFAGNALGPDTGSSWGPRISNPHQPRAQLCPGIGRQFPMEWALGHVFLGRPGGEVDRRGDDPSRARQGRPRIRRHSPPDLWRAARARSGGFRGARVAAGRERRHARRICGEICVRLVDERA